MKKINYFVSIVIATLSVLFFYKPVLGVAFLEQPDDSVKTSNWGSAMTQTLNYNQLSSPIIPQTVQLTGTWSFVKVHFGDNSGIPIDGNNKLRLVAVERFECGSPSNILAFIEIPYTGDGFYTFNFSPVTLNSKSCYDFGITLSRHGRSTENGQPYGTNDTSKYPYGNADALGGIGGVEDWYFVTDIPAPGASLDPVVIVPGLMGSEEKDGQLILQPRLKPYDSLKLTLLANGYTENQTLFDFPYNWRKSNAITASLLRDKIQEIKTICQCSKVDIVAHSMGGLVARQYIESDLYQNDIDQLVLLGTPNLGTPESYLAWEGGTIHIDNIFDILRKAFIRQEALESGFKATTPIDRNIFDYIRSSSSPMLSIQELLPIYDYLKDLNTGILREYPNDYPQNSFLENLNSSSSLAKLEQSGVRISNLFSDNQNTINFIRVENDSSTLPMWEHGLAKDFEFGAGDTTVPATSSLTLNVSNVANLNIGGTHFSLPTNGVEEIYQTLTGQPPAQVIRVPEVKRFFSIFAFSPVDMMIMAPDGKRIGKDFATGQEFNEIDGAFYTGFNTPNENIFIPEPLDGEYTIQTQGTAVGSYEISAGYAREEIAGEATSTEFTFQANTAASLIENLKFNFSSSSPETAIIIPEDTTAPTITHTLIPLEITLNSQPIVFTFSAQDNLTGVFKLSAFLDGDPLNSGDSVSFDRAGSHQIIITAEDFLGNITTENINFSVVYNFGGFLTPVKADGSGIYKLGRTLPVKFQLTDANAQSISSAFATLTIAKFQDGIIGTEEIPISTSAADTGNVFRYDTVNNQYIYNLSTNIMSMGSLQLKVNLDDGRSYTVLISIK